VISRPNRIGFLPFALVSFGIFLAPSDGLRLTTSLTYSDALFVAAVPFLIWDFLVHAWFPRLPTWLFVGVGLIVAAALLIEEIPHSSLPQTLFQYRDLSTGKVETSSSAELAGQLLVATTIVPMIVALTVTSRSRARILISLWLAGTAMSCIVALLAAFGHIELQQALTGHNYSVLAYHEEAGRYTGLAVHAVLLGISAAMSVPIALSRMSSTKHTLRYGLLTGVYCAAALVSGSRSAVIGIFAAFALIFIWNSRSRRRIFILLFTGSFTAYVTGISSSSLSTIQRLFGENTLASSSAGQSDSTRLNHYSEALQAIFARPLTGYGFQGLHGAHNIVLELLSSGGILALTGYFLIVGGVLRAGLLVRSRLPFDLRVDAIGVVGALVAFLVVSMVDNASLDRFVYLPVGIILGLCFLVQREAAYQRLVYIAPRMQNESPVMSLA
jgi:O-antigen ligase